MYSCFFENNDFVGGNPFCCSHTNTEIDPKQICRWKGEEVLPLPPRTRLRRNHSSPGRTLRRNHLSPGKALTTTSYSPSLESLATSRGKPSFGYGSPPLSAALWVFSKGVRNIKITLNDQVVVTAAFSVMEPEFDGFYCKVCRVWPSLTNIFSKCPSSPGRLHLQHRPRWQHHFHLESELPPFPSTWGAPD